MNRCLARPDAGFAFCGVRYCPLHTNLVLSALWSVEVDLQPHGPFAAAGFFAVDNPHLDAALRGLCHGEGHLNFGAVEEENTLPLLLAVL